jgi:hypothetical protein
MMDRHAKVLASIENFGKIYRCGNCDNIHVQIGAVSVLISVDAYMQLVALVNTSASNFETSIATSQMEDHEPH